MSDTEADDAVFSELIPTVPTTWTGRRSRVFPVSAGKYADLYEKGKTSTSDIRAHMGGFLHLGRTLPADPVDMDRQSRGTAVAPFFRLLSEIAWWLVAKLFIAILMGCCSNWFAVVPEWRRVRLED